MNNYDDYVKNSGLDIKEYTAYYFGNMDMADSLCQLVLNGDKRVTTGLRKLYDIEAEPIPKVNDYAVVLNSKNLPQCIIQITAVYEMAFNQINTEYAFREGEGDKTLKYWKDAHRNFWLKECEEYGIEFKEDMLCVCEEFEIIYK